MSADAPTLEYEAEPILQDFPDSFESERLLIRAPRAGDGALVSEAVLESLVEMRPWMDWVHFPQTPERCEESIRRSMARWILREDLRLNLFDKVTGRYIGGSGLHRPDWDARSFEIGYWIRTSEAKKGYMTEAVRAITAWAFDTLRANRVEIRMDARNERSWKVAERAGFPREAVLVKHRRALDGVIADTFVYARSRP
ncbi:MAG: GNAT family N-acetyltransferase [Myxococcales bacterium]|nr:GNAT family N-acetyltransferase [Myxococcales bacterium]